MLSNFVFRVRNISCEEMSQEFAKTFRTKHDFEKNISDVTIDKNEVY